MSELFQWCMFIVSNLAKGLQDWKSILEDYGHLELLSIQSGNQ